MPGNQKLTARRNKGWFSVNVYGELQCIREVYRQILHILCSIKLEYSTIGGTY